MYILRKFNLIGGRIDFQYVSSIDYKNGKMLFGYSTKIEQALNLTDYQSILVEGYFKAGEIKYKKNS